MNRLTLATENPASGASCPDASSHWCELFSYDSYGNRSMTQSTNTGIVAPINFSPSTNQITYSGWGYDHSGNLNRDFGASLTYKYDAENRMVASCAYSDGPATCTNVAAAARTLYGYDGDGRRVTKQTPSGTLTTFIYDASGELAAEYGPSSAPAGTEFLTADYLGSTRVITNSAQVVVARHDFRPFGDEIPGTGVRQGIVGYSQDGGVRQEFTSKERDAETGLDYFGARYFSSAQGRFTSPDPTFLSDQRLVDPQQWNLYSYTRNNPLKYVDPDGMEVTFADAKLKTQFMNIAAQSSTLMGEYNTAEGDSHMNVQVVERGLKQNEQGSQGDTTVSSTDENGVTKVIIYVDPYRTSEDTIVHEWGHEKDAREMGGTAFVREAKQEQSQFPGKEQHNQRPVERSADKFKDQVNKERKAYRKTVSEQKKAEQRAEKERKKKEKQEQQEN